MKKDLLFFCFLLPAFLFAQKNDSVGKGMIHIRCGPTSNPSNEPLWIVDGLVSDSAFLRQIDPQQIESITVLKDVHAMSLYGSHAVNGVVLITTKRVKECGFLIKDEDDSLPIKAATVTLVSRRFFESNATGNARLGPLPKGRELLAEISCIGYHSALVQMKFDADSQQKTIYLKKDYKNLSEVVIIGYPTIKHRSLGCGLRVQQMQTKIYPNPISIGQTLTVLPNQKTNGFYQIISVAGQMVASEKVNVHEEEPLKIAIKSWPAGAYLIRLIDEASGKSHAEKFVIQ